MHQRKLLVAEVETHVSNPRVSGLPSSANQFSKQACASTKPIGFNSVSTMSVDGQKTLNRGAAGYRRSESIRDFRSGQGRSRTVTVVCVDSD